MQRIFGRSIPPMRQARELTLANGRKHIAHIASALQLKSHHVDAAQRLFSLAANRNFTQGRKILHVVAACLYIVCRRQKTHHMLIDFSDILQTNVFVLGNTFLKLCKLLNMKPPVIDPSLYIHRFAAQLEFENQESAVANTALRLVQRMKRDWIQTGRRPSGVCGAALLIAAKIHGFRRTHLDIIRVVKICDVTLRKRLYEFEDTPTSDLTLEQFTKIDLNSLEECDPPSVRAQKKKESEQNAKRKRQEGETPMFGKRVKWVEEYDEGNLITEEERERAINIEEEMNATLEKESALANLTSEELNKPLEFIPDPNVTYQEEEEMPEDLEEEETLSNVDSDEIDMYLNTEEEIEAKTVIWNELNAEHLKELEEAEKLNEEKQKTTKPKQPRKKKEKIKEIASTPAEAVSNMLQKKVEKSAKTNYSVTNMANLFSEVHNDFENYDDDDDSADDDHYDDI